MIIRIISARVASKGERITRRIQAVRLPWGLVRGKYAKRMQESSNIIVLKPEVAEVFPNEKAVNRALLSLIEIAQKTARLTNRSTGRTKKLRTV